MHKKLFTLFVCVVVRKNIVFFVHAGSFRHFASKMPPPSRREAPIVSLRACKKADALLLSPPALGDGVKCRKRTERVLPKASFTPVISLIALLTG